MPSPLRGGDTGRGRNGEKSKPESGSAYMKTEIRGNPKSNGSHVADVILLETVVAAGLIPAKGKVEIK